MFSHIVSKSSVLNFIIASGALRVTDPCYSVDTWCSGKLDNVKNGNWLAQVGYYKCPMDEEGWARREKYIRDRAAETEKRMREKLEDEALKNNFTAEQKEEGVKLFQERNGWIREDMQRELDRLAQAKAEDKGRVAYIRICHEAERGHLQLDLPAFEKQDIHVGVDSGQAGFFDLAPYTEAVADKSNHGSRADSPIFQAFYDGVCDLTLSTDSFGAIEFGAVSSSGYGDGGYDCYARKNDAGEVIDAYILFIGAAEDSFEQEEEGEEA